MDDGNDERRGGREAAVGKEAVQTARIVGGRRTLPPGTHPEPARRVFVNPYVDRLDDYPAQILQGEAAGALRGCWRSHWDGDDARRFLGVEIGSGNGFFLRGQCQRHPDRRFVGLEIRYKRVWMAARKLVQAGCSNGAVVLFHAGYLRDLFTPGELDALYLNHPDPWPKKRHAGNRMITRAFAEAVCELLAPGGALEVKSDHLGYADDLRRCFAGLPAELEAYAPDLHRPGEPLAEGNILTNYERKFVEKGEPVFYMRWVRT